VKFLVDAQLPPALARWLSEAGHQAEAVREIGLRDAEDDAIWQHALTTSTVIVTKDEDFATRLQQATSAPQIVWLRVGNTSNRAQLAINLLCCSRENRLHQQVETDRTVARQTKPSVSAASLWFSLCGCGRLCPNHPDDRQPRMPKPPQIETPPFNCQAARLFGS